MGTVLSIAIPKGGSGKTTTTMNLGAALQAMGKRVLLVDLDPQANLTVTMGVQVNGGSSIYQAIQAWSNNHMIQLPITQTSSGLDVLPASARLNKANEELAAAYGRERVIADLLEPVRDSYDFILIDTLPYLGVLVVGALMSSDAVIIPVQSEYLAAESTSLMLEEVRVFRQRLHPKLKVLGIVLTMVDQRQIIHREAVSHARAVFSQQVPVYDTVIERSVRIPESQAAHKTIFEYDPASKPAQAYKRLAVEVLGSVQQLKK